MEMYVSSYVCLALSLSLSLSLSLFGIIRV
jgi:hypothetical protein